MLAPPSARSQVPEYEAKAEFLERFTRFIDWPPEAGSDDLATPFVIGVLGRDPFGTYLDGMAASRRIKGKPVQVRRLSAVTEVNGCHLLFISGSEAPNLPHILSRLDTRPILTVGDTRGFAEAGVLINLVSAADRIAFEVNEDAVRRSRLKFSSKLLKLARLVGTGTR